MKPDDVCLKYSERSVGLLLRLLKDDDEELAPSVLIEGSREALTMLGELFLAVASREPTSSISLSPTAAGSVFFSKDSELGFYIHHIPRRSDQN